jgi:hypothetical protein
MINTDDGDFAIQQWQRDSNSPVISLGQTGSFDDMHLFAPCVIYQNGVHSMWYSGSRGEVGDRVFNLGMATSTDGVNFHKCDHNPVYTFGDGRHSILTPTVLRSPDGSVLREDGQLRMWFASTDFPTGNGLHTLHATSSSDGNSWSPPSQPLLEDIYAPTIIREDGRYKMWYIDVAEDPWYVRYGESGDGFAWDRSNEPVLQLDQPWEAGRLFYPTVLKYQEHYFMWYGSYLGQDRQKTALGFAVSADGIAWTKNPQNPVFQPEPTNTWESHYTTSQSVIRYPDGSWRIWYATRTGPPFVHKYLAIGTAHMEDLS